MGCLVFSLPCLCGPQWRCCSCLWAALSFSSCATPVEKRPPSLKSKGRVALVRAPWVGWIPGVEPLHSLASSSAQAHPLDAYSSLSAEDRHKRELGFPSDLIGSHSFPHFVVFLSRLWSLPASSRSSYRGGWYSSSLHPPMVDEEWSRLGRCSMSSLMDQKNRNPNWDRWGQKDLAQGSQSWGGKPQSQLAIEALSPGKSESKEDIMTSSSGDGGHSGNPKSACLF